MLLRLKRISLNKQKNLTFNPYLGLLLFLVMPLLFNLPHLESLSTSKNIDPGKNSPTLNSLGHQVEATNNYGKLPLRFEPNVGQPSLSEDVRYFAKSRGYTLFLTDDAAVISIVKPPKRECENSKFDFPECWDKKLKNGLTTHPTPISSESNEAQSTAIYMRWKGGLATPEIKAGDKQAGITNYFIGNDPTKWRTDIPGYGRVDYSEIYPGIGLSFYEGQDGLEYDFVVKPGANLNNIRLEYQGAQSLKINDKGTLEITTALGTITQLPPKIYQLEDGAKKEVQGQYLLHWPETSQEQSAWEMVGQTGLPEVGFSVESYNLANILVIDPSLVYSTYLGGSGDDWGFGIAVDGIGSTYVTGYTDSNNFPLQNPFQGTKSGFSNDVFITKLNANGNGLAFSTYLGGTNDDYGMGITVSGGGNVIATGYTNSNNFPITPGAYQTSFGGPYDAFVTKFNSSGGLVYSTYLGGSSEDYGKGIAVDNSNNIYVVGYTNSTNFPKTPNAYQSSYGGGSYDAFVTTFNINGGLIYSTFIGGNSSDYGRGIATDGSGNAYVTGYTLSNNFPVGNAFQSSWGGTSDVFVTAFNINGGLIYSTYLGNAGNDYGTSIAVDGNGNAYVMGGTNSSNFPIMNPLQSFLEGGDDVFITKFNAFGSLLFSSYLGGGGNDFGYGIAVDNSSNIYVTGYTNSTNFPKTPGAYQSLWGGNNDTFITKISPVIIFPSFLVFSEQPGGASAGSALTPQPVLEALKADHSRDTNFNGPITLSIKGSSGTAGATLGGSRTVYARSGLAIFPDLSINLPGNDYRLIAGFGTIFGTFITAESNPFNIFVATPRSPGRLSIFDEFDQDDLYTPAISIQATPGNSPSTTLNFVFKRYYGLVETNGHLKVLKDSLLHDNQATLYLLLDGSGPNGSQAIMVNGEPNSVNIPDDPGSQHLLAISLPKLDSFKFPDICTSAQNQPSCLRNPNKQNYNYPIPPNGYGVEPEDSFSDIQQIPNTISLPIPVSKVRAAYFFLNGVRPVLMMEGIDFQPIGEGQVKDTTSGWGAVPDPGGNDTDTSTGGGDNIVGNKTRDNWIKWLSDAGIPNWNPPRNGNRSLNNQLIYLDEGSSFLKRVYGAKKINLLAHSMGGIVSHIWINFHWNRVDHFITFDSPHGGVKLSGLGRLIGNAAAADLGPDHLREVNKNFYLPRSWYSTLSDTAQKEETKKRVFLIGAVGQKKIVDCTQWPVCFPATVNWIDDGLIKYYSSLGTNYEGESLSLDENLPSHYSTLSYEFSCPHEIGFEANNPQCHGWVYHNDSADNGVKNWVRDNTGIFSYTSNFYPHPAQVTVPKTPAPKAVQPNDTVPTTTQNLLNTSGQLGSSATATIPFILDQNSDVMIDVSGDQASFGQARIETAAGSPITTDQPMPAAFSFPGTVLTPGNYKLILSSQQ